MKQVPQQVRETIQHNCHIADARHGADFGMCTYLLKMREYYRWEQGLGFGDPIPREGVGDWLSAREAYWAELVGEEFREIPVDGRYYDPFDAEALNTALEPYGLVYSSGLVQGARPNFFLGRLLHREDPEDGFALRVADQELARGLNAPPAMTRGRTIFLRRESLRRYLWERVETWRWHRPDNALGRALECYPFDGDPDQALEAMTANELTAAREHEIGEFLAGQALGDAWGAMLLDLAHTPAELMARAVRDHLADCSRTLPLLIREGREPSILFFIGNLSAMRKELFPGLYGAYGEWWESGDTEPLSAIAGVGAKHWLDLAREMLDLHRVYGPQAAEPVAAVVRENRL